MPRSIFKAMFKSLVLCSVLLLAASSCSDPESPAEKKVISWPDMSEMDDVIRTMVLCYNNPSDDESIHRYIGILHSGYRFYLNPYDVTPETGPFLDYSEDSLCTAQIFDDQTYLELEILAGQDWYPIESFEGQPCENCWEATRGYYIKAQFGEETAWYVSPVERAFTRLIVAPDESDPAKWVLRAQEDLDPYSSVRREAPSPAGTQESSWSAIKTIFLPR